MNLLLERCFDLIRSLPRDVQSVDKFLKDKYEKNN